ncbi:MAG: bifunctional (p)ppGpp synthetase/guanosine-3',5'-bis(diphosphate) 3'-pyrophosphohydrolase [Deltaproteobacteria bacterium]|nr:bifunctional (p)ppGpp synthetase/guanosine-3',5'-bis(diphosphate) 3'-pyrophosphohydrolase [Deltaproteobacteria bacterium]
MIRLENILDDIHRYNPQADLDLIRKAYVYSAKVHHGQLRRSGEPYLVHPLEVADILSKMHLDAPSIATGLLHDTVEDTLATIEEVRDLFGPAIARLVDGVTKLSKINFVSKEQRQAENFRKMFMAMAEDIRVILVKLADRLHNMRTLEHLPEEKQIRIAEETLEIYAPIAGRLGMEGIKGELDNLCLKHLKPDVWKDLNSKVQELKEKSGSFIEQIEKIVLEKMAEYNLKLEIRTRLKQPYSIYQKMQEQQIEFDQVYDLIAFRLVVPTISQCYEALGIIHSLWRPVPGRFKDYIGMPKTNNYQSLHTTVVGPQGQRVEFQIRTKEMDEIAEMGIASHWNYKEGGEIDIKDEVKFRWIRRFMEWQKELSDPAEYLDTVKLDLFASDVYVFTPKGDLKELPRGSTPVDFAYAVHTDVGHQCVGARVNGRMVPLRYQLKSGDSVDVRTSQGHKPSKDWLKFVRTSRAKAKIRQFIREEQRERATSLGHEILMRELERFSLDYPTVSKGSEIKKFMEEKGLKNLDHLLTMIGYGRITAHQVLSALLPPEKLEEKEKAEKGFGIGKFFKRAFEKPRALVNVDGYDDILVSLGKCCNPIPGDSIVGFITRGQGVKVHSATCSRVLASDPARRITVSWNLKEKTPITTRIRVVCVDKPGILADISQSISAVGVNISRASCHSIEDQKAINTFEVGIKDLNHLHQLMKSLQKVRGVISVDRVRE